MTVDQKDLLDEIERDPKAFFDRTDAMEGEVEDRKWAQAKWLSDESKTGKSHQKLAEEVGRGVSTVYGLIQVHRQFGNLDLRPDWYDAREAVTGRRARRARRRQQPEKYVAPETIAKALENPEVAKAVKAAMTSAAMIEMLPDPVEEPVTLSEVEPEAPEPDHNDDHVDSGQDSHGEDEPDHNAKPVQSGQHRPSWVPKPPTDQKRIEWVQRSLGVFVSTLASIDDLDLDDGQREKMLATVREAREACEAVEYRLSLRMSQPSYRQRLGWAS